MIFRRDFGIVGGNGFHVIAAEKCRCCVVEIGKIR